MSCSRAPLVKKSVDKMDNTNGRRYSHQPIGKLWSPRLQRSRSGAPALSLPETDAFVSNPSPRLIQTRSRSTTKSRGKSAEENLIPSTMVSSLQKKPFWEKESHSSSRDGAKKTRVMSIMPSAWASSPGRSPQPQPPKAKMAGGVLKYFRQKKVCPVREEEVHRFRLLHNTALQWRLVNARTEAAITSNKTVAEDQIFSVWLKILKMRKLIVEARVQLQKAKHEMKLLQIVKAEMSLLNEWTKIEKKNHEAVQKVARKLWAHATRLPLLEGAKGDVLRVYNAMGMANGEMQSTEALLLSSFFSQAEKTVGWLQQLIFVVQQHNEWSQELQKTIPMYASQQRRELSLRAHLIQFVRATPGRGQSLNSQ